MIRQVESMANSLCVKQDSIIKLIVASSIRFTAMEVYFELPSFSLSFRLGFVDLRQEKVYFWSKVFFVYHIKSNNHICVLSCLEDGVNLSLDVILTNDFESACYDFHLEQRKSGLDQSLNSLKNGDFFFERNGSILIEQEPKDMFPLNGEDHLLDHILGNSVENHFEELGVVVQFYKNQLVTYYNNHLPLVIINLG